MKKILKTAAAVLSAAMLFSCTNFISSDGGSETARSSRSVTYSASSPKRVTGYFVEWGIYGAHDNFYATSIPFDKVTHINYAFVGINPDTLEVEVYDPWASQEIVYSGESWDTEYKGNLGMLYKLKQSYPDVKILISVGGWTKSHGFHAAAKDEDSRKKAAASLVAFMKQYHLDGIDIDWEYPGVSRDKDTSDEFDKGAPGGIEDKQNFTLFLKAIREKLDEEGELDGVHYELTAAIGCGYDKIELTEPGEYSQYLDALNLMSYDMHGAFEKEIGHQAPLYANVEHDNHSAEVNEKYNVDWAVNKLIEEGVSPSKIVIGIPFYSRGWNDVEGGWDVDGDGRSDGMFGTGGSGLAGTWGAGGQSPYFKIKELEGTSGWEKFRDETSKACWLYNPSLKQLYTYDDQTTVKQKVNYINDKGLGGAMFWEIDGDDWKNGYDLVNIISEGMIGGKKYTTDPDPELPDDPVVPTPPSDTKQPETTKATGVPGAVSLEQNCWNGEATFGLKFNMWWGNNGTKAVLYENGTEIDSVTFEDNSPSAQSHTFTVTKTENGTYQYKVALINSYGTTESSAVSYTVTKASTESDTGSGNNSETGSGSGSGSGTETGTSTGNNDSSYKVWSLNGSYSAGDLVVYNSKVYKALVTHTAYSSTWNPEEASTLWSYVKDDDSSNGGNDDKPPVITPPSTVFNPPSFKTYILTGYWQNFNNGAKVLRISEVPSEYDLICVSFADAVAEKGAVDFTLDTSLGFTEEQFIADIKTVQGRGQHVIISVGGQNGTIVVNDDASAQAFASSIKTLMSKYGFEGVDIDLENGINAQYMEKALRLLPENSIITMAPETVYMQNTSCEYFKLALAVTDILTVVNTQYYNSGSMLGQDGKVYSQGSVDFLTALSAIQLENGLAPCQVGLGLPASTKGAGSGYVDPDVVIKALDDLVNGTSNGSYKCSRQYKGLRGVMTWSINWDASNGYEFSKKVGAKLSELNGND